MEGREKKKDYDRGKKILWVKGAWVSAQGMDDG